MFQGASSALVQFWESKGMVSPHLATVSPGAPWPKPRGEAAAPQPRTVEVASPEDELLLNVQVVVSLLGAWEAWDTIKSVSTMETLHGVTFVHEGSCAIAQDFFLAGVRAKPEVPNPTLLASLLQAEQIDPGEEDPDLVKAIHAGRAFDSPSQVLKVMDSQTKLASRDMTPGERVDLLASEPDARGSSWGTAPRRPQTLYARCQRHPRTFHARECI